MKRGILQRLLGAKRYRFDVDGKHYSVITMPIHWGFGKLFPTTKDPTCILEGEGFQVDSSSPEELEEITIVSLFQRFWFELTHFKEMNELRKARQGRHTAQ